MINQVGPSQPSSLNEEFESAMKRARAVLAARTAAAAKPVIQEMATNVVNTTISAAVKSITATTQSQSKSTELSTPTNNQKDEVIKISTPGVLANEKAASQENSEMMAPISNMLFSVFLSNSKIDRGIISNQPKPSLAQEEDKPKKLHDCPVLTRMIQAHPQKIKEREELAQQEKDKIIAQKCTNLKTVVLGAAVVGHNLEVIDGLPSQISDLSSKAFSLVKQIPTTEKDLEILGNQIMSAVAENTASTRATILADGQQVLSKGAEFLSPIVKAMAENTAPTRAAMLVDGKQGLENLEKAIEIATPICNSAIEKSGEVVSSIVDKAEQALKHPNAPAVLFTALAVYSIGRTMAKNLENRLKMPKVQFAAANKIKKAFKASNGYEAFIINQKTTLEELS